MLGSIIINWNLQTMKRIRQLIKTKGGLNYIVFFTVDDKGTIAFEIYAVNVATDGTVLFQCKSDSGLYSDESQSDFSIDNHEIFFKGHATYRGVFDFRIRFADDPEFFGEDLSVMGQIFDGFIDPFCRQHLMQFHGLPNEST